MVSVKTSVDKIVVSPFKIPTASRDFDLSHFFGFGFNFDLPEEDFDRFRVVVGDEFGVAQLVNKWLTASCKIVGVEERACASRNDESSASLARTFSWASVVQCFPRSRLRLGVRYPGS
jgi:hypothetical protein